MCSKDLINNLPTSFRNTASKITKDITSTDTPTSIEDIADITNPTLTDTLEDTLGASATNKAEETEKEIEDDKKEARLVSGSALAAKQKRLLLRGHKSTFLTGAGIGVLSPATTRSNTLLGQ